MDGVIVGVCVYGSMCVWECDSVNGWSDCRSMGVWEYVCMGVCVYVCMGV